MQFEGLKKELVFAHVDKATLNISEYPQIDSDTVVIATHQYGLPSEVKELAAVCHQKGVVLIEDCAGSLGSKVDGQLTGTFGDYGVFSFSASKTLHSPTKGGFIIAKDPSDLKKVEKAVSLKPFDAKFKTKQLLKGVGFCMNKNSVLCSIISKIRPVKEVESDDAYLTDPSYTRSFYEWQAYVVGKQFARVDKILEARKRMFRIYEEGINNPLVQKPIYNPDAVNIRYAILVKDRPFFLAQCRVKGVQVGTGYNKLMCPSDYIVEKEISQEVVYLPFGSDYSDKEINQVISVINSVK